MHVLVVVLRTKRKRLVEGSASGHRRGSSSRWLVGDQLIDVLETDGRLLLGMIGNVDHVERMRLVTERVSQRWVQAKVVVPLRARVRLRRRAQIRIDVRRSRLCSEEKRCERSDKVSNVKN